MPGAIAALRGSGTPFSVLTKGTLMRRDLPLLRAAATEVPVGLGVSMAISDDELHAALEPGTPTPAARLAMVRAVRDAGLPCGVVLAPVLPGLTDTEEHLDAALGAVAASGATGVTVLPLHLRPGAREWWTTWLRRAHPHLTGLYRELYGRGAYVPRTYRDALRARVAPLLARHGLAPERGGEQRGVADGGYGTDGADGAGGGAVDEGSFPAGSLPGAPTARPPVRAAQRDEPATLF